MEFNITSCDRANEWLLTYTDMSNDEYLKKYEIECQEDFEQFWDRYHSGFIEINIEEIKFVACHFTGSLDQCDSIKKEGLKNLREMLKEETPMGLMLKKIGVTIDIDNKKLVFGSRKFNIDVSSGIDLLSDNFNLIYNRIYRDFAITGFLYLKDIESYGAGVEKCPEFLKNLAESLNIKIDQSWIEKSEKYKLHLKLPLEIISNETFELSTEASEVELKKWMLHKAIEKSRNLGPNELFVYMKNDAIVLPEYISKYEKI